MTCSTPTRLHLVPALASDVGSHPEVDAAALSDGGGDRALPPMGRSLVPAGSREAAAGTARPALRLLRERGMATAEYAVGLIAACAFAGVLYKLVTSSAIYGLLNKLAEAALRVIG